MGALTLSGVLCATVVAPAGAAPAPSSVPARQRSLTCHGPALDCVRDAKRVLARLRDGLGCDHRAPFPSIYTHLQQSLEDTVRRPGSFDEPQWLAGSLNTGFLNLYLDAYRADDAGRPVPRAWRIAFDAARTGDVNAGQDVLLGANAHIQRDMPYVLAALGLTRADGTSRKRDYDRFQAVVDRAYGPAVREVARRYDPLVSLADDRWNPIAGYTAHGLFSLWRQRAWSYAEQLAEAEAAGSPAARARVVDAIEANAAQWATLLAVVEVPGYRTVRDTYCQAQREGVTGAGEVAAAP
ncbi:DUF5995 family protein [Streptomyces sp. NPDC093546]|uniref:DUF5995 family protein n=1 Tax=Streptomyces sp. NPDC093546 TaxID=3366040 RepID=UPI003810A7A2